MLGVGVGAGVGTGVGVGVTNLVILTVKLIVLSATTSTVLVTFTYPLRINSIVYVPARKFHVLPGVRFGCVTPLALMVACNSALVFES